MTDDTYPSVETLHVHPSPPHHTHHIITLSNPMNDIMFASDVTQHTQGESYTDNTPSSASAATSTYDTTRSRLNTHDSQEDAEWEADRAAYAENININHNTDIDVTTALVADVFAQTHHRRSSTATPPLPISMLHSQPGTDWEQSSTSSQSQSQSPAATSWESSSPSPSPSPQAVIGSVQVTPSALDATLSPILEHTPSHNRQRSGVALSSRDIATPEIPDHSVEIAQLAIAPSPSPPPYIRSTSDDVECVEETPSHAIAFATSPHSDASSQLLTSGTASSLMSGRISPGLTAGRVSPRIPSDTTSSVLQTHGLSSTSHVSGLTTALHQRQASQQGQQVSSFSSASSSSSTSSSSSSFGLPPLPLDIARRTPPPPISSQTSRTEIQPPVIHTSAEWHHHSRSNSTGSISGVLLHDSPTHKQPHHHKSSTLPDAVEIKEKEAHNIATLAADADLMAQRGKLGRLTIVDRNNNNNNNTGLTHTSHVKLNKSQTTANVNVNERSPRKSIKKTGSAIGSDIVVKDVERKTHVTYDPVTGKFNGLPKEWEHALKRQFGLPPSLCETMKLDAYPARIPSILIKMQKYLYQHDGLRQVGIFRLAPEGKECEIVKEQLNNGTFQSCQDVNVMANLIKVWFRDLPVPLLHQLTPELVASCTSESRAADLISTLHEPNQSIFLWLLDLATDITQYSDQNKMTAKNVAIVIAPNLYRPPTATASKDMDPMKMLTMSKHFTTFMEWCIIHREQRRKENTR